MRTHTRRALFECLESRQMLAAVGDLDSVFGTNGRSIGQKLGFEPVDIAMLPNGSMIAVGTLNGDFAVAKTNIHGRLDSTFGRGGIATADFGGKNGDRASAVAVARDGKIVVVGTRVAGNALSVFNEHDKTAIARFTADGRLDTTFDKDGKVVTNFGALDSSARDVAIDSKGRIVVVGQDDDFTFSSGVDTDLYVMRLLDNGARDKTFGKVVRTSRGTERSGVLNIDVSGDGTVPKVLLQPDGKIVLASQGTLKLLVTRVTPNGTLDGKFGRGGTLQVDFPRGFDPASIVTDRVGRYVVAGTSGGDFALARITPGGQVDGQFNGLGRVTLDMGGIDRATSVLITPDSKIIVGGTSEENFALARFDFTGRPDSAFGNGGKTVSDLGRKDKILAMQATELGRIRVAGAAGHSVATAQYIDLMPRIDVTPLPSSTSESGGKAARFVITRDQRSEYITRVFYSLGGTAVPGVDYLSYPHHKFTYLDIQPGQTFAEVGIVARDDTEVEGTETVTFRIADVKTYLLGTRREATVRILDNDLVTTTAQPMTRALFSSRPAAELDELK